MQRVLRRVGAFFAAAAMIVILNNLGFVEAMIETTVGLVLYWCFNIGMLLWLFFGVAPAVFEYVNKRKNA